MKSVLIVEGSGDFYLPVFSSIVCRQKHSKQSESGME